MDRNWFGKLKRRQEQKKAELARREEVAESFEYGLLLVEFESLRAQLDLAIAVGDVALAEEITPKLAAATKAVRDAHAKIFPKVQAAVDAFTKKEVN